MSLLCLVVIPVYNGERNILSCLDAVALQATPLALSNTMAVNDDSRDLTAPLIRIG
jgi:hypothetical protein